MCREGISVAECRHGDRNDWQLARLDPLWYWRGLEPLGSGRYLGVDQARSRPVVRNGYSTRFACAAGVGLLYRLTPSDRRTQRSRESTRKPWAFW